MAKELNELAQKMGWKVEWTSEDRTGPAHQPVFAVSLHLRGFEVARETGSSIKEARNAAARAAMSTMRQEPPSAFGNRIARMVQEEWVKRVSLPLRNTMHRTVLAGFVQSSPTRAEHPLFVGGEEEEEEEEEMKVVAVCAGTAHRLSSEAQEVPRRALNDSHAEVLARRALLKHLYRELEHAQGGRSSIFQRCSIPEDGPFELKRGVRFHLYISMLPCGDACCCLGQQQQADILHGVRPIVPVASLGGGGAGVPTREVCAQHWPCEVANSTRGQLRAKMESGESLTPLPRDGDAGMNGRSDLGRLRKMSCSDKMLRWNVLGIQGALLSHLLSAPLFLASVSVGDPRFNHNHLARALCCRLSRREGEHSPHEGSRGDGGESERVERAAVHHPALHFAPYTHPQVFLETSGHSEQSASSHRAASWAEGDRDVEWICDAARGVRFSHVPNLSPLEFVHHLQQRQSGGVQPPKVRCTGPPHEPLFSVTLTAFGAQGTGAGRTIRKAEMEAAHDLLKTLDAEPSISERSLFERFGELLSSEQALLIEVQSREGRDLFEKAKTGARRHATAVRGWNALLLESLGQPWLSQRHREREGHVS